MDARLERISTIIKKTKGQIINLIDAYISLAEDYFMNDSEIIDELTNIFTREELEQLGFGNYIADYFDDREE